MNTLQLFIICATIIGGLSIICYTAYKLLTSETAIKAVKEAIIYDYPKAG